MSELEELQKLIDERFKEEFDFYNKEDLEELLKLSYKDKLQKIFGWIDCQLEDAYLK